MAPVLGRHLVSDGLRLPARGHAAAGRPEGRGPALPGAALRRGGRRPGRRPVSGPSVLPRSRALPLQRDRRRRAVDLPGPDGSSSTGWPPAGDRPAGWPSPAPRSRSRPTRSPSPIRFPRPRSTRHLRRQAGLPRSATPRTGRRGWPSTRPAGPAPAPDLVGRLQAWWEPLLALAPTLRQGVGANVLVRAGEDAVLIDFPPGRGAAPRRRTVRLLLRPAPGTGGDGRGRTAPSTGPTPCSCPAASGLGGPASSTSTSTTSSSRSPTSASSEPRPRPGTAWLRRPRSRRSSSAGT